ncbi:MAG: hypothetical protein EP297_15285 [Gammaproteobacteria bacterium]|nr:MAG: hypothetical protein EP297_15285 [Gammaproteobacteria bacterium]
MKIQEPEALDIAKQFVMGGYKESNLPIDYGEYKICLEKGGFGHTVLGPNENYWSATFLLKSTEWDTSAFDPEYIIVFLDAESGEPNRLPEM